MLATELILYVLFLHWLGDFVFQTDAMAKNKSTSWMWLCHHITAYQTVLFVGLVPVLGWKVAGVYALANGGLHFLVDAVTSRINSYLWKNGKVHWFFVSIGFDQFLHTAGLLLLL